MQPVGYLFYQTFGYQSTPVETNKSKKMYVTTNKLSEMIGYTPEAIRNKVKKGVWHKTIHYIKAPDGRLMMNVEMINKWIEGKK